jgi:hypothetical protein
MPRRASLEALDNAGQECQRSTPRRSPGRLVSKVFLKMSADGYSSWTVPHKMFSKLRGAMNGGCSVVFVDDAVFDGLIVCLRTSRSWFHDGGRGRTFAAAASLRC